MFVAKIPHLTQSHSPLAEMPEKIVKKKNFLSIETFFVNL